MMGFKRRTNAPGKNNKWFYKSNPFYQCGYGLPNCTAYAWGRFAELLGKKPKLCLSNAENWYSYKDGYKRGKKPKLGAVIVWAKGKVGVDGDGAGHVAIVEAIYEDGSFLVSESGWGCSKIMWTTVIPKNCKRSGYSFQGFIYNPAVNEDDKVETVQYEVGVKYKLQTALKVRAGASTSKAWLKRTDLDKVLKKSSQTGKYAVLNVGTKVTCEKMKGNWMKISTGWICCKSGADIYVR